MVAYSNLGELDIKLFEQRFSLLWNSLFKISVEYICIMGGNMTPPPYFDTLLNTTSITTFALPPVYAINKPWVALFFVSVAIMFFAAVFSLVIHLRCHARSLPGFVSSLIRDSKFFSDS
ncbi:hypothetical protein EJ02DRAFT_415284 [Clathrospora elynae]|uniref:Uncharacterized protein n=1 Tax=Clathrospora elynae TaxID=706981 RepID=A0A6A5S525_9PLEO|nr:hypothetical protein EJ02DRAFT_415284 [Clathrospora elynae]